MDKNIILNVLVACEESQRVCVEFRKLGHNAFSCDLLSPSGKHPEWHIKGSCLPFLNGDCNFKTMDGKNHNLVGKRWDLIIGFPPCTYLSIAGNRYFNEKRYGQKAIERKEKQKQAAEFFLRIYQANCTYIAVENPVGYMNTHFCKPTQIIHPYYFGDSELKRTCLWLKGLPLLIPTNILQKPQPVYIRKNGKKVYTTEDCLRRYKGDFELMSRIRSKTFLGIARAMAEQWSVWVINELKKSVE